MSSAPVNVPAIWTPPERRGPWFLVKRFFRNFLGCWPLIGIFLLGLPTVVLPVLVDIDGWGKRITYWWYIRWSRGLLRGFGVRVWVKGLEHVTPQAPYIITPNHRSHMDIPVLGATLPVTMVAVHKKSLELIPGINLALWMSRSVGLHRNDTADARRRLKVVQHRLATGRSVLMFPEGRRSKGSELERFKKGAAVVALEQKAKLLPITIIGTDVVFPPGKIFVNRSDVLVIVHPPVDTSGRTPDERDRITAELQKTVEAAFVPGPATPEMLVGATRVL